MSFWAGILLEDVAIGVIDRMVVDPSQRISPYRLPRDKFRLIGPSAVFLPAGCVELTERMADLLAGYIGGKVVFPHCVWKRQKEFQKKMVELWSEIRGTYEESIEKLGAGVTENDCLVIGMDPRGAPFMINISSGNGFRLDGFDQVPFFMTSPSGPSQAEIDAKIGEFIIKATHGKLPIDMFASLLFSPRLNKYTSQQSNLLMVRRDGVRVFGSRLFRPWRYKERAFCGAGH